MEKSFIFGVNQNLQCRQGQFTSFERLQEHLGVPAGELADRLQIASRTLARRRGQAFLQKGDQSGKTIPTRNQMPAVDRRLFLNMNS